MILDFRKTSQHLLHLFRTVRHRIQSDDCVTGTETEAFQRGCRNTLRIVGGMVGLEPAAQGSGQTDGGIAVGGNGDLAGRINQIQIAHQLADCRNHLRRQSPAHFPDIRSRSLF